MSQKVWIYKNKDCTAGEIAQIAKENHIPPLAALLLKNRGIVRSADISRYIKKSLEGIHDPSGLCDMDKATERVVYALEKKEKITVYGDYDVDGVTATALLVKFLKEHGADVSYYIPDRENEGYGINVMAVNKISKTGTKLMITVDCGITACGEVELAKSLGMDVIITDHHLCKEKLPSAAAVIDPKRPDSQYPFDALAGVGVAFKFVLSIARALGEKTSECFFKYVEFAAIGTVADVVSLLDENRVIVQKGITSMKNTKNAGIKALLEVSSAADRDIGAGTVAFMLAPRINAGGRLGSAEKAVGLLLSEDDEEAAELAKSLEEDNRERRVFEQKIFEEALLMIKNDTEFDKKRVIVLAQEGWHHGVIGIVASRITERFYRPCILLSCDEKGNAKGSGRSVEGFHLFDALSACSALLVKFGGHAMAAGLSLKAGDVDEFSKSINSYAEKKLGGTELIPKLDIDCELAASMVTVENAKMLEFMEPFGESNPKPVFSIRRAIIKKIDKIGADKTHLRLVMEKDGVMMNAVGFKMGEYADSKKEGDFIDAAFSLELNNFRNTLSAQLMLKDLK